MNKRFKKFLSHYRPYKQLFITDMIFAFIAAEITLVFPIITRYINGMILSQEPVEFICNYFITYQGYMMDVKNNICDFSSISHNKKC